MSPTPLKCVRRALILALNDSAEALVNLPVEVVDDGVIMVLKGLDDLAKAIVPKCFHSIVPPCQVKPCHCGGGVFVENVHKFEVEVVCPLQGRNIRNNNGRPFPAAAGSIWTCVSGGICLLRAMTCGLVSPFDIRSGSPFPDEVFLLPCPRGLAFGTVFPDGFVLTGKAPPSGSLSSCGRWLRP